MNRRILVQVTAPAVVIGLILFGTCLVSAWIVNRLQTNLSRILSENVSSLEAAQDLEIQVRRLHSYCVRYLIDPNGAKLVEQMQGEMRAIDETFRQSLGEAKQTATTRAEQEYVREIKDGYDRYRREFERLRAGPAPARPDFQSLVDDNPIRHVVRPCEDYLRVNKELMNQTRDENARVTRLLHLALLLLGVGGPVSGLMLGWGMARGLSRSIHRLSVSVKDMTQQLGPAPLGAASGEVASVSVVAGEDVHSLDRQLEKAVVRVREVVEELQARQQEVLRAQQLSAVGQLAASVAHEVRNPLMSMKMLVDAALRAHNPRPVTADSLALIRREIVRVEKTVQGLLDFSRPPPLQRGPCDLRAIVTEAVALVETRARQQGVQIETRLPELPVAGVFDAGQLSGVLVNLFLNALDAMPKGGRLEVSLRQAATEGMELVVADNGPGIPAAMEGRLFTPFASSKPTGTGLGLCVCRRVVEGHGGRITADNRREGGARFTVTLPAHAEPEATPMRNVLTAGEPGA